MAARARSLLVRTAFAVLVTGGLVFLLLEASARVYLFGWSGLAPNRVNSVHGLHQTGFLRRSSEPRLGWELSPNIDSFFKLVPFQTNSQGLRDREYTLEKPAGTFRVAVLGASFALPAGVAIEDAFHSLLEEHLSEATGRSFEFLNFAVGMYTPEQVMATLELRALAYDPDLIVFTTTRLSEPVVLGVPPSKKSPKKAGPVALPVFQKTYPILQSFLLRLVEHRLLEVDDASAPLGILEQGYVGMAAQLWPEARPLEVIGAGAPAPPRSPIPVLERLGGFSAETGIPVVIVRLEFDTGSDERWGSRTPKNFALRCRALSLHCHDTRDAFEGSDPREFWIHPLDPHPNAAAQARFARSLGDFLAGHGLLGPGTGES
jgi:hypothetical protein